MHAPLWSKLDRKGAYDGLVGEIADTVEDSLHRLRRAGPAERRRWGHDFVPPAAAHFFASRSRGELARLMADSRFRQVAEAAVIPVRNAG
jgi:hypothetical protein